jgi:hypothetical protein
LDHRALEFGEHAHHLEERLAAWRRGVNALLLEGSRTKTCKIAPIF